MEARGLSYRHVEEAAGWPLNTLTTALGQRSNLSVKKALSLSRALEVPIDWLFDDTQGQDGSIPPETLLSSDAYPSVRSIIGDFFDLASFYLQHSPEAQHLIFGHLAAIIRALDQTQHLNTVQLAYLAHAWGMAAQSAARKALLPEDHIDIKPFLNALEEMKAGGPITRNASQREDGGDGSPTSTSST